MKLSLTLIIINVFVAFSAKSHATALIITLQTKETAKKPTAKLSYKQSKKVAEWGLGRKLNLKEKISLRLHTVLQYSNAQNESKANTNAVLGFVFAVAGVVILWPLLIPGIILSKNALKREKENPGTLTPTNLTLAKIGKVISIVGLILLTIIAVIVAIVIASGGFAGL